MSKGNNGPPPDHWRQRLPLTNLEESVLRMRYGLGKHDLAPVGSSSLTTVHRRASEHLAQLEERLRAESVTTHAGQRKHRQR